MDRFVFSIVHYLQQPYFFKDNFFRTVLGSQQKLKEGAMIPCISPCSPCIWYAQPPPLSTSPSEWQIRTIHEALSPQHHHPKSILGGVHSMSLNKRIMMRSHHYRGVSLPWTIFYDLPHHSFTSSLGHPLMFCYLYSFAFSRTSYSWSHTPWSLFRWTSFT